MRHVVCRAPLAVWVIACTVCAATATATAAEPPGDGPAGGVEFAAHRKKALAGLQPAYERVASVHASDDAIQKFRDRVTLIDEVAGLLVARLRSLQARSVDKLIGAPGGAGHPADPAESSLEPLQLLSEYRARFAEPLPRPQVNDQELDVLLDYYNGSVKAAQDYVLRRAKTLTGGAADTGADGAAGDPGASAEGVSEACVVLPFLSTPDAAWKRVDVDALPAWVRRPAVVKALEDFALSSERPLTAYVFATYGEGAPRAATGAAGATDGSAGGAGTVSLPQYLRDASGRLVAAREYHAAIRCAKVGVQVAEGEGRGREAVDLLFALGEIYGTVGHEELAADTMRQIIDRYGDSEQYGKAALLRLKYLYESDQAAQLLKESPKYEADKRSAPYLPQILYVRWVAHRQANQADEAKKVQDQFLAKFPAHPLCADMYFASATNALAVGNYQEAARLLEIIQYRYPDSKIMPKVKELQGRIAKALEPAAAK